MNSCVRIIALILLIVICYGKITAENLYVTEPRRNFYKYPASIEEMTISVKPQGNFTEAGVFLTFSPEGSKYKSETDTLEIVFEFELPEDAFINDMWLFLDDSVYIKAKIVDKWTAGFIYEGIVQRRADPSILYKVENGKYKVKIFPLLGNSTRTLKMNIFLPNTWGDNNINTALPVNFINVSSKKVSKIKIHAYPDKNFNKPYFIDNPNIFFTKNDNLRFGISEYSEITDTSKASKIAFISNEDMKLFVNISEGVSNPDIPESINTKENFYQVKFNLDSRQVVLKPKKIAFLLDYDENKSNYSKRDVLNNLMSAIQENLNPMDSFNIFISGNNIIKVSSNWLPADTSLIANVFSNLKDSDLSSKSNLANLLYTSSFWICDNSDSAIILLISCSDQNGKQDTATSLGTSIISILKPGISINICSFVQKNWITNWVSGMAVTGNDYLYGSLVRMTKGIFNKIQDSKNDLKLLLNNTLNSLLGGFEEISTNVSFDDGFAFDKHDGKNNSISKEKINLTQYGKFVGKLPMRINITGYYRKYPFQKLILFNTDSNDISYDNRSIWAALSIKKLEDSRSSNYMMLYDIINKSLTYRVLSIYTSFLATEDMEKDTINPDRDIPVELIVFKGSPRQSCIDLYWETASEINNYGFFIERRIKNSNKGWEIIAFVNGFGNSKVTQYYQYSDVSVDPNNTYQYRLRQIDIDGSMNSGSLSNVIEISYYQEFELVLEQNAPNPFSYQTMIRFKIPQDEFVRLEIIDIYGNIINTLIDNHLNEGNYEINWNADDQHSNQVLEGIYFCKLTAGEKTKIIKMCYNK